MVSGGGVVPLPCKPSLFWCHFEITICSSSFAWAIGVSRPQRHPLQWHSYRRGFYLPNYTMTTVLDGSSLPIYVPLNVYAMYFIPSSNHWVVDHPLPRPPASTSSVNPRGWLPTSNLRRKLSRPMIAKNVVSSKSQSVLVNVWH